MLTSLRISGFKSFDDFEVAFSPHTLIVGDSASGKTSLLQAISLLQYASTSNLEHFLTDTDLCVSGVISKFTYSPVATFDVGFRFGTLPVQWKIAFNLNKDRNSMTLLQESVIADGHIVIFYDVQNEESYFVHHSDKHVPITVSTQYDHSMLRFITAENKVCYPILALIKNFFMRSFTGVSSLSSALREKTASSLGLIDDFDQNQTANTLNRHSCSKQTFVQQLYRNDQVIAVTHNADVMDDWCSSTFASVAYMLRDEHNYSRSFDFLGNSIIRKRLQSMSPSEIVVNLKDKELYSIFLGEEYNA